MPVKIEGFAGGDRTSIDLPASQQKLLEAVAATGKPVVVCLMKMREADSPAFLDHFKREVIERMPAPAVATLAVPQLTRDQLVDPNRNAPTRYHRNDTDGEQRTGKQNGIR